MGEDWIQSRNYETKIGLAFGWDSEEERAAVDEFQAVTDYSGYSSSAVNEFQAGKIRGYSSS